MAPEQLSCEPLTRRTDLYALGIVLWELLVGERLFPGGSRPDLLAKVEGLIPRPRSRVPALSPDLDDIVMRALATAEADRFATALDMVQALESAAAVAPRCHVAAWVERHAQAALAERAALLANVETMARSAPPPAMDATEPSGLATLELTGLKAPAVPSISVPNLAFTPPGTPEDAGRAKAGEHKRRAPWIAAAAAVGLVSLAAAAFALRASRAPALPPATQRPDVAAAPRVSEKRAAAAMPAAPPTALTEGAAAPPAPALAPAAPKAGALKPPAPKAAASPPLHSKPRATVKATLAAKPAANAKGCTPPYTTDAQGRRKYKVECF
jgi:serine/threonine-protein kinase